MMNLFSALATKNGGAISSRALTESFGWSDEEVRFRALINQSNRAVTSLFQVLVHQDIQELNRLLFEQLEIALKGTIESQLINDLFRGIQNSKEEFQDINLSINEQDSVEASLSAHTQMERLSGDNRYYCEQCQTKVDAIRITRFQDLPPILTLSLSRFYFDADTMQSMKLEKRCSFPLLLNMNDYLWDPKSSETLYDLFSIVIHVGANTGGGHYHAFVKDPYGTVKPVSTRDEQPSNEGANVSNTSEQRASNWSDRHDLTTNSFNRSANNRSRSRRRLIQSRRPGSSTSINHKSSTTTLASNKSTISQFGATVRPIGTNQLRPSIPAFQKSKSKSTTRGSRLRANSGDRPTSQTGSVRSSSRRGDVERLTKMTSVLSLTHAPSKVERSRVKTTRVDPTSLSNHHSRSKRQSYQRNNASQNSSPNRSSSSKLAVESNASPSDKPVRWQSRLFTPSETGSLDSSRIKIRRKKSSKRSYAADEAKENYSSTPAKVGYKYFAAIHSPLQAIKVEVDADTTRNSNGVTEGESRRPATRRSTRLSRQSENYSDSDVVYGRWFDVNDDCITEVDPSCFERVYEGPECAYLLFYMRRI